MVRPGEVYDWDQVDADYAEMHDELFPGPPRDLAAERIAEDRMVIQLSEKHRSINRELFVFPQEILMATARNEDLAPYLEKARQGRPGWGRAWVVHTTWRCNRLGTIPAGSLLESRGQLGETDKTFDECCRALEPEDGAVGAFEYRVITAPRGAKR